MNQAHNSRMFMDGIKLHKQMWYVGAVQIKYCPFCGTRLKRDG